tara:strand:+ start:3701 stop:4537 length:837 start_codon:yes stop_codon:yes gene_type:complete
MIYDYILSTGDATISGCSSSALGADRFDEINLTASNSAGTFYFDNSVITGAQEIMLSANGQTLFQEVPKTGHAQKKSVYSIFTGDFFIKTGDSDFFEKGVLFFETGVSIKGSSSVLYDKMTGYFFAGTGDENGTGLGGCLGSGIRGKLPAATFDQFHYFLNGQKVYTGRGVSGTAISEGFIPDFNSGGGGVVSGSNTTKFKALAYLKRDKINQITGEQADVYGAKFIENQTNFYLNGVEELSSIYLELYTGVSIIKTGVGAIVDESFGRKTTGLNLKL